MATSLKKYTQPQLWKREKAGEAQGHSHNRVQSFSMNIRQAAATTENVC